MAPVCVSLSPRTWPELDAIGGRPPPLPSLIVRSSSTPPRLAGESGRPGLRFDRILGRLPARARLHARKAEVHHAHLAALGEHDVVGLEVAVHEAGLVRGRQPPPCRQVDVQHLAPGAVGRRQPVADGVPLDELHRDEDRVLEGADVVDDHHVRVRQARDRLRLTQEARAAVRADGPGRGGPRAQQLDGDLSIQLRIVRGVDLAHPAPPQQAEHDVAPEALPFGQRDVVGERFRRRAHSVELSSTHRINRLNFRRNRRPNRQLRNGL